MELKSQVKVSNDMNFLTLTVNHAQRLNRGQLVKYSGLTRFNYKLK